MNANEIVREITSKTEELLAVISNQMILSKIVKHNREHSIETSELEKELVELAKQSRQKINEICKISMLSMK